MEDKAFDLLVKMVESHKKDSDKRFNSIEDKIDQLLQFKWQIIGGSAVLSIFITLAFQIGMHFIKKAGQ